MNKFLTVISALVIGTIALTACDNVDKMMDRMRGKDPSAVERSVVPSNSSTLPAEESEVVVPENSDNVNSVDEPNVDGSTPGEVPSDETVPEEVK